MGLDKATSDKDVIWDRFRDLEEGKKIIMKKEHLLLLRDISKNLFISVAIKLIR